MRTTQYYIDWITSSAAANCVDADKISRELHGCTLSEITTIEQGQALLRAVWTAAKAPHDGFCLFCGISSIAPKCGACAEGMSVSEMRLAFGPRY